MANQEPKNTIIELISGDSERNSIFCCGAYLPLAMNRGRVNVKSGRQED